MTASVRGADHDGVTFAVGELDPNFGNHPALLALTQNGRPIEGGPELVVPGDRTPFRFVPRVTEIKIGIAAAAAASTHHPRKQAPITPASTRDGSIPTNLNVR